MASAQIVNFSVRSNAASYKLFEKYRPLRHGEIRLLELLPSSHSNTLSAPHRSNRLGCNIVYASLDGRPHYEALSYVWGNSKPTEEIIIVNHGNHRFQITESLLAALTNFQDERKSRWLWVDFLCINQKDEVEKAQQVAMMTEIYVQAAQVLGWLGTDEANDSVFELNQFLRERDERKTSIAQQHYQDYEEQPYEAWDLTGPEPRTGINPIWLKDFGTFLSNPFFSRIWIVQEVAVAKRLVLCFNQHQLPWNEFRDLIENMLDRAGEMLNDSQADAGLARLFMLLSTRNLVTEHAAKTNLQLSTIFTYNIVRMDADRPIPQVDSNDFARFVDNSRSFGSTDPRDRIFALRGLMPEHSRIMVPDYNKNNTADKVYRAFAVQTMVHAQNLDILSQAGLHDSNLPSWVPDYTRQQPHQPLNLAKYNANPNAFVYHRAPTSQGLGVTGYFVGTIKDWTVGFQSTDHVLDPSVFARAWEPYNTPPPERIEIMKRNLAKSVDIFEAFANFSIASDEPHTTPGRRLRVGRALLDGILTVKSAMSQKNRPPKLTPDLERAWSTTAKQALTSSTDDLTYTQFLIGSQSLPGIPAAWGTKWLRYIREDWNVYLGRDLDTTFVWPRLQTFRTGNKIPVELKVAVFDVKGGDREASNPLDPVKMSYPTTTASMDQKVAEYKKKPRAERLKDDDEIRGTMCTMFNREVERMSRGRKLAVTERAGGVAWVPQLAQRGDQVWLLNGARVPFVLRPVSGMTDGFRVVGECYHAGVMYGEYFEQRKQGELPRAHDLMVI